MSVLLGTLALWFGVQYLTKNMASKEKKIAPVDYRVSKRATALQLPEYMTIVCPDDVFRMSIAENVFMRDNMKMLFDEMKNDIDPVLFTYDVMGYAKTKELMAAFMSKFFFGKEVVPERVLVNTSVGNSLEFMAVAVSDPGDVWLVPSPYYVGFDFEMIGAGIEVVGVPMNIEDHFKTDVTLLEDMYQKLTSNGKNVNVLLMCSPYNPFGKLYTIDEIEEISLWGFSHSLHVIWDEIYACSVWGDSKFISASHLYDMHPEVTKTNLHILYGISKDFGLSGGKQGYVYTENQGVLNCHQSYGAIYHSSGLIHHFIDQILSDLPSLADLFERKNAQLRSNYELVVEMLDSLKIPFIKSEAGFFMVIDFSRYLPLFDNGLELWKYFVFTGRVTLSYGISFYLPPGFHRLCFSTLTTESTKEALSHLSAAIVLLDKKLEQ